MRGMSGKSMASNFNTAPVKYLSGVMVTTNWIMLVVAVILFLGMTVAQSIIVQIAKNLENGGIMTAFGLWPAKPWHPIFGVILVAALSVMAIITERRERQGISPLPWLGAIIVSICTFALMYTRYVAY